MQGLLNTIVKQDAVCDILKISCFIQYASRLRSEILLAQSSSHLPNIVPHFLPVSVVRFLASTCVLSEQDVDACWSVVKELVWSASILDDKAVSVAFKDHGADKGLSPLFPLPEAPRNLTSFSSLGSQYLAPLTSLHQS
jgi:hypothetical protein